LVNGYHVADWSITGSTERLSNLRVNLETHDATSMNMGGHHDEQGGHGYGQVRVTPTLATMLRATSALTDMDLYESHQGVFLKF
jgi:hypothetical protein